MKKQPSKNGRIVIRKNTLLVDGNGLLKTAFHGASEEFNQNGEHIGGIYQFLTILRKLLTDTIYHRVYVFWDGKFSGKLRYELYSEYKANRNKNWIDGSIPDEEELVIQKYKLEEYMSGLFIRQLTHPIVEADDFIAYYCNNKSEDEQVTICSKDRDFCQLIEENIRIYLLDKKVYLTRENFSDILGYYYKNTGILKIITGDTSDNIKGVKGVQGKTLFKFFPEFLTEEVSLNFIIEKAILLQEERINSAQKPLSKLSNIINGVTNGAQGKDLYEINKKIVDLKNPLLTIDAKESVDRLINGFFDMDDTNIKPVYEKLKNDGLEDVIGKVRFPDYLLPFKLLLERDKKLLQENNN